MKNITKREKITQVVKTVKIRVEFLLIKHYHWCPIRGVCCAATPKLGFENIQSLLFYMQRKNLTTRSLAKKWGIMTVPSFHGHLFATSLSDECILHTVPFFLFLIYTLIDIYIYISFLLCAIYPHSTYRFCRKPEKFETWCFSLLICTRRDGWRCCELRVSHSLSLFLSLWKWSLSLWPPWLIFSIYFKMLKRRRKKK